MLSKAFCTNLPRIFKYAENQIYSVDMTFDLKSAKRDLYKINLEDKAVKWHSVGRMIKYAVIDTDARHALKIEMRLVEQDVTIKIVRMHKLDAVYVPDKEAPIESRSLTFDSLKSSSDAGLSIDLGAFNLNATALERQADFLRAKLKVK